MASDEGCKARGDHTKACGAGPALQKVGAASLPWGNGQLSAHFCAGHGTLLSCIWLV